MSNVTLQDFVKPNETATDTYQKLKIANGDLPTHTQIFWWHKEFLERWEASEHVSCFGKPVFARTDTNVEKVTTFGITMRMAANNLKFSNQAAHELFTD